MKTIENQEREIEEFKNKYSPIISIESELEQLRSSAEQAQQETEEVRAQYAEKRSTLKKLEQQVAIYDERISFAELGVYEPHFDFGDSETYKESIKAVRERQKGMVSSKEATICPANWTVDGSRSKGQTMVNRQTRLTMRAFNNECEAAIANTRWNNVVAMEKRILNAAKQINNANASMNLIIHEAPAEAVGELGQVARQMLGAEMVVGAMKGALDVAQNRVDPSERGMLGALRSTSGHERLVNAPGVLHGLCGLETRRTSPDT